MIDAIIYVEDFQSLVDYLSLYHPELLLKDESGFRVIPPVVTGFSRTPAVTNEGSVMVYARLRDHEVEKWRGMPESEVLAETLYVGEGTADTLYNEIFSDPEKLQKYDNAYDRTSKEYTDDEGDPYTVTPPDRFGVIAGA